MGRLAITLRLFVTFVPAGARLPDWRGLLMFALILVASQHVRAETRCPIPDGLALKNISLPAAKQAVMSGHRLVVLILGGAHTAGDAAGDQAASYPGQLESELREALPEVEVSVKSEAFPGSTAADIPPKLPALLEKTGANLVIWGPGGRDIALRLDQDEFLSAVTSGIEASRGGGADLILLDMIYLPAPTRMAMIEPYRERLRLAAATEHVPLLRRYALMQRWSEDKTLNLQARDPAEQESVARRLYSCMAQSLALPIAAAVR
jgi:acyl-CoA thioesterase I